MLTTAAPALADTPDASSRSGVGTSTAAAWVSNSSAVTNSSTALTRAELTQQVIDRFDPYITFKPEQGFVLDLPRRLRFNRAEVALVQSTIRETNTEVAAAGTGLTIESHGKTIRTAATAAAARHGGGSAHWWGYTIWLDEWATNRLIALIAGGASIAQVAAAVTSWTGIGGLSAEAIAALLYLGAAAIKLCDWHDRGVNFHLAKPFPFGPKWCTAR